MKDFIFTHNPVTIRLYEILTNPQIKVTNVREAEKVEGGLTIDYIDEDQINQRIVIGYTELGEWIEYDSQSGYDYSTLYTNLPIKQII